MYIEIAVRVVTAMGLLALAGYIVLDFYSVTHTGIVSQGEWWMALASQVAPVIILLSAIWFTWPRKRTP